MPEFPPGTRVAAYPRVSTEEQKRHGLSIADQRAALQNWADQHGLKIVDFYDDAGNSARKPYDKRPAMVRLLNDVQAGKVDLIIFTWLDRWFRNVAEYYKVQAILDAHNVQWKAIYEDYDTTTASGRFKVNIMLSVAQSEADRDSERIRSVFAAKRARKEPVSGSVPVGYIIRDKKVVKDPATEKAVSAFFDAFLRCHSVDAARKAAAEEGLTITYRLAQRMLCKEVYYGRFYGVDGMAEPYITPAQHKEIDANRSRKARRTKDDRVYPFSGLVFCAECGRRMGARTQMYALKSGGYHERVTYSCPGYSRDRVCRNKACIAQKEIEAFLLDHLEEELNRYLLRVTKISEGRKNDRNFQEEQKRIKKRLSRLKDLYVDDIIDIEMYRRDYEDMTRQLDRLAEEESAAAKEAAPDLTGLQRLFSSGWKEMYGALTPAEKQAFWRLALERISITPSREIFFTFRV